MTDTLPPRGHVDRPKREDGPAELPVSPSPSPRTGEGIKPGWEGPTYYGRGQLKPAPFNNWIVGGYIFVAGLGGSAALLAGIADLVGGRRLGGIGRRGRYLAALAPAIGAPLLIWDLHTPKRFYNMLRVAKPTSPMSIGTWILMAFTTGSLPAAAAQFVADVFPGFGWLRGAAKVSQAPAAVSGAGLSVYTATLLSATSTPTWAASVRTLPVRFGASSVAAAASALLLGERDSGVRRTLETLTAGALAVELTAGVVEARRLEEKDLGQATKTAWGRAEGWATGLGVVAPLGLLAVSLALGRRAPRGLAQAAAVAAMAGSAAMKIAVMGVGDESASRPEISFRYSQPEHLPRGR